MKQNDLLWCPPPRKATRTHDGTVMVAESDRRWCSDTSEIRCWNNAKVRVAFKLDCCDREVMSWVATTGGINGQMIRDLIAESVDARFGAAGLPHSLQ